jgi:hypothetical protein
MNPVLIRRSSVGCTRGAHAATPFIIARRGRAESKLISASSGETSRLKPMKSLIALILAHLCLIGSLHAVTNVLFDASQDIRLSAEGTTSDTFVTRGYRIQVTKDKLFTGGVGLTVPIGRNLRVLWPAGMEVQGVTSGPMLSKAKLTITRVDGQPFSITAFTLKLLANTYGAGGAVEVMPLIDGEDGLPDPVAFDVTGFYSMSYSFNPTQFSGQNYDSYQFTLYVDYAITSLTLVDRSPSPPTPPRPMITAQAGGNAKISWPVNGYDYTLQTCTDLESGSWVANFGETVVEGGFNVVHFVPTDPRRFFRLSK